MNGLFKTGEFRMIAAGVLFIALPSVILSVVALAVLARESRLADERLRDANEGAAQRAVDRTLEVLRKAQDQAARAADRIREEGLDLVAAAAAFESLCGPDRAFLGCVVVEAGGRVLVPDAGPDLPPLPVPNPEELPEICRDLLAEAQHREFAEGSAVRAALSWRALHLECLELEGEGASRLKGTALFGQGRCEGKAGNPEEAKRLFGVVADRYRSVWGEGDIPLAAPAQLELARLAAEEGDLRAARDSWLALATFLARNEREIPPAVLAFFRDRLVASGVEGTGERWAEVSSLRASLASFRALFGPACSSGLPPAGWLASATPREWAFVVPLPEREGEAPARAALFRPNRPLLRSVFRQWALDAASEGDVSLVLSTPEGRAEKDGAAPAPEGRPIAEKAFPPPLSDWRAVLHVRRIGGVKSLWVLRWSLTLWVILATGAAVVGGTFFVVRAVNREIRLAREKADFVSSVTHELKTPLTSIRMFTETLMLDRVRDEGERRECLKVIAEETDRLSRLIHRMLDFSKMERGLRRFVFTDCDPAALAREALQAVRGGTGEGREADFQLLDPLPVLRCDRDAVVEVLVNLVGNAVKYTPDGSPPTLRVWAARGRVKFAVMDRGIGIPRAERRRIFQKFYRVDDSLTKEVDGCGLGLAISAHIARAHGGAIQLDSEPGRGSIFTLDLPERGPQAGREEGAS